jgi:S-adenosyl methyltransferase
VARAVRFCLAGGIDQFLDLGSGVPTVGNVHEIVQAALPTGRVLYVDYEPVAVEVTRALLGDNDVADMLHADLRQPECVLGAEKTTRLLDLSRPVAVIECGTADARYTVAVEPEMRQSRSTRARKTPSRTCLTAGRAADRTRSTSPNAPPKQLTEPCPATGKVISCSVAACRQSRPWSNEPLVS